MARKGARNTMLSYHCGISSKSFKSRSDLEFHTLGHEDSTPPQHTCLVCNWTFDDILALETHQVTSGHTVARFSRDNCGKQFSTARGLSDHTKSPMSWSSSHKRNLSVQPHDQSIPLIVCDRCSGTFRTSRELTSHRSFPSKCSDAFHKSTTAKEHITYVEPEAPKTTVNDAATYGDSFTGPATDDCDSETPTNMSKGQVWCSRCKTMFESESRYQGHVLRCITKHLEPPGVSAYILSRTLHKEQRTEVDVQKDITGSAKPPIEPLSPVLSVRTAKPTVQSRAQNSERPSMPTARSHPSTPSPALGNADTFMCSVRGCGKQYKSAAGLKVHNADAHGIGGQSLDLHGRDSWMLNQRAREMLKSQGLLRPPQTGSLGRGSRSGQPPVQYSRMTGPRKPAHTSREQIPFQQVPTRHAPVPASSTVPVNHYMQSVHDMETAKSIQGKTLRLLIQSDIFFQNDNKPNVCGIEWTRIDISNQPHIPTAFEKMCHLPKGLQDHYLPPPNAYPEDYKVQYPVAEFRPCFPRILSKPGLDVVALSCMKVVLADGRQEIVKIAAIDVLTGRILMNHLICTTPNVQVANWRSSETGFSDWHNMEQARQAGYKVFRGWTAARSALWKFVDKETIIVGHNLRSDLDALRMEHGRAVDIAKVAEKAAKGALSRVQIGLDSLCRSYTGTHLTTDPDFGRDVLMNAFAMREVGIWVIKNTDMFEKTLHQKSLDYQKIMPRATFT